MKKGMKGLLIAMTAVMAFVGIGAGDAKADEEEKKVRKMKVEYVGDPVPYEEVIDKDDFEVYIYYYGENRAVQLDSGEFTISPNEMENRTSERVKVSYEDTVSGRTFSEKVTVKCKSPDLQSITVEYNGDDLIKGSEISRDDVTVTAYYSDDTEKEVSDWEFERYSLTEGRNTITVTYEENDIEESDTFSVYAYEGELERITARYKGVSVNVGGKLVEDYIVVTGYFDTAHGDFSQRIYDFWTDSYTIKEGNNTITVKCRDHGKVFEAEIVVKGVVPSSQTTSAPAGTNGWQTVNGRWKYMENGSYAVYRWVQNPATGLWFWMDAEGYMAANTWVNVNGAWYWLDAGGAMATGWELINGKWYFLDEVGGQMLTGWKWSNGKCYYLTPGSGEMATNCWIGNWYVDGEGVWTGVR